MGHRNYGFIVNELLQLHEEKSRGYGDDFDPLANFTRLAKVKGQARFVYALDRDLEKTIRCYSLIRQRRFEDLGEEFLDKASLMICAEAMRREDEPRPSE